MDNIREKIGTMPKVAYNIGMVFMCLLGTYSMSRMSLIGMGIWFGGAYFVHKTRKTSYRYTDKEIAEKRQEWNNYFQDDSFDKFFADNVISSELFEFIYNLQFQKRILEQKINSQEYNEHYQQSDEKTDQQYNSRSGNEQDILSALKYFGYNSIHEVNESILKKKYKKMLTKAHPDNGGSVDETQKMNFYYDVLKRAIV